MKILHIASWWPSRVYPTHGNFVQKHVRLVAREHEVVVLAIQEDWSMPCGKYEVNRGYENGYYYVLIYFGRSRTTSPLRNLISRGRAYQKGVMEVHRYWQTPPSLIHGHVIIDGGIVASLLAHWWRIPYVISEHGNRYWRSKALSPIRKLLAKWSCRKAARILPVSDRLAWAMQTINGLHGNYRVVPNVVDAQCFSPGSEATNRPHQPLRLLHVSTFDPNQKNITGLLRVFATLINQCPGQFHLHLAGDGDLNTVATLARSLALNESVLTLSGPHTEKEVAKLMQQSDAFVLFSNYETQGVVLLEALCCGLPCLATAVGGVIEVIQPGENGYLVAAGDEASLVEATKQLSANYASFKQSELRKQAINCYGEAAVGSQLNRVYQQVLAEIK